MPRKSLKGVFLAGLVVALPAVLTAYVLWLVFSYLDGILEPLVSRWLGFRVPGLGLVALVSLILLMGLFASNFLGQRIVRAVTARLERIPLWSPVYRALRDISEVVLQDQSQSFRSVALLEWPRPGMYAMVFITSERSTPADRVLGRRMVSVFLPTTPNPTTGFYLLVAREQLTYVDMSIEQALKVVISAGAAFDARGEASVPATPLPSGSSG
jgi:uncharacterized membrane protein